MMVYNFCNSASGAPIFSFSCDCVSLGLQKDDVVYHSDDPLIVTSVDYEDEYIHINLRLPDELEKAKHSKP